MLKYQSWYASMWTAVLGLYALGWSSLNGELSFQLQVFFLVTIAFSIVLSILSSPIPVIKIKYVKRRRPVVTLAIAAGFIVDWLYGGALPLFEKYQGFDSQSVVQQAVGIPVFHVVLTAVAIFHTMYISYLALSDRTSKSYMKEFLFLLLILLLNNSRGYIVFCIFIATLLYVSINTKRLSKIRLSVLATACLACLLTIYFISIYGNIRSGVGWNDCSYIQRIGLFTNYPEWLSKHFMWAYSYITSPLANLNLDCIAYADSLNIKALLFSFLPEQLSAEYLSSVVHPLYVVLHLNASTGFASFACSAGVFGLYIAFFGMIAYYTIIKLILRHFRVLETFGNSILCFLTVAMLFFGSFSTSALCYLPLFLIVGSAYLSRKLSSGSLQLVACE